MNRLVSANVDRVSPGWLPPKRREDRTRVLFITNDMLGWRTFASAIERFAAVREDIDAVHIRLQSRLPVRLLSADVRCARGWLDPHVRRVMLWRRMLRRWLTGPLPLCCFDVIHVAPQLPALAVAELKAAWGGALSVSIDSTVMEAKAQRKLLSPERLERSFAPILRAERRVMNEADLVASMSRWSSASLQREHGVPAARIMLFPPVVEAGVPAEGSCRDGTHDSLVRIAFVGNDWERKGGPRLLRWHQQRWAARAELNIFSRARPITNLHNVVWHGSVPNEDLVQRWLPSMDMFVLPTHSDMSPWAAVEAASVGLPIVTTAIGGLPDIVVDGRTGYLLGADDERGYVRAVERLIGRPGLRIRMGRAARRHACSNLDPGAVAGRFLDRLVSLAP
ncbi:MAG: glycosyltransferase family 4 protein [Actinomycetota bacterium]|nr:glycosyltransferase family 4 protein [Actinomycetota bacterium]